MTFLGVLMTQCCPNDMLQIKSIQMQGVIPVLGNTIIIDGRAVDEPAEIIAAWAAYYEEFSNPSEHTDIYDLDMDLIRLLAGRDEHSPQVTLELLENTIKNLHKNKAADLKGLCRTVSNANARS